MQWVCGVVAERHVEKHLAAVMIRRWLEGLSRGECNLAGTGVRNGTCSECVVCGTSTMRTGTLGIRVASCVMRRSCVFTRLAVYGCLGEQHAKGSSASVGECECNGWVVW